ncbi:hypothetical protein DOY81_015020 [Sarcophaga bullata]|nr:hypothetical protein DOY81_015020 [Sarcophaga bullata]
MMVMRHALNVELTQNVVGSHSVNVCVYPPSPPLLTGYNDDPPSPPLLTGYNDGDVITSGSVKKLQCSSSGGNPPPSLIWYKNDKN